MRPALRHFACAAALTMFGALPSSAGAISFQATGTPTGFSELAGSRQVLVDVYYGGRKVGEALAAASPGTLRFRAPRDIVSAIPGIIPGPELDAALSADLPANSQAVCSLSNRGACGRISPAVAGIIYDEDHFRVDLFINPRFLRTSEPAAAGYLPVPDAPLSLTSMMGLAISGTVGGATTFNVQNRTIVGLRNARVRADTSLASHLGLIVDDLVAESDRGDLRYSGGLFWTPGNDFTGQRRIAGLGVGTQFDTSADREELRATPVILFLAQPARVELLVDGRLASSRSYPAGNVNLDTSALPDGSYSLLVRIHESDGNVREERRFFAKYAQLAPLGHPLFYAYAGLLANTRRDRPVSISSRFYYQAGAAWRLTGKVAVDVAALGTGDRALIEAGGWLLEGSARVRAAGLVSSRGDAGTLLQLSAGGHGPLNLSLDVRRIWSSDGKPLVPSASHVDTFGLSPPTGLELASGSYTQATGSLSLLLGPAYLALVGSYRKDRDLAADYSIGPSINWPLATRNRLQLVFEASAQRTRSSMAAFAGLRMLLARADMSVLARVGQGYRSERGDGDRSVSRAVGSISAQYSHESADRTLIQAEAGLDRDVDSAGVHARGALDGRFGEIRADLLHNLEGRGGTQYDIAYQSAIALGAHAAAWGARDPDQSAIVIAVGGDAADVKFDVIVDGVARGRVRTGGSLSLFVPGYRTYKVRLVPVGAVPVDYDSSTRSVTLYPGNVQSLAWRAQRYFTIFAQAVSPDGSKIADALVQSPKGIGETDADGHFQLDVRSGDPVTLRKTDGGECRIALAKAAPAGDFASVGRVICR